MAWAATIIFPIIILWCINMCIKSLDVSDPICACVIRPVLGLWKVILNKSVSWWVSEAKTTTKNPNMSLCCYATSKDVLLTALTSSFTSTFTCFPSLSLSPQSSFVYCSAQSYQRTLSVKRVMKIKQWQLLGDMICLEGSKRSEGFFSTLLENEPTTCIPWMHYIINFSPNHQQMLAV